MIKYSSAPQSPAEPAGVPWCSLPGALVSIIPSLWLDIFCVFKDSQRCCRDSHSAAPLANHVLCLQGYSRFLWTVGGAHLPFSLKIRVRNESHRLFFCFFASRKIIQKSFISYLIEWASEQIIDLLCQTHCISMWYMYNIPTEVRQTFCQTVGSGILCRQSSSLFFSKCTQQIDCNLLWAVDHICPVLPHLTTNIHWELLCVRQCQILGYKYTYTRTLNHHHHHQVYISAYHVKASVLGN